MTHTHQVNGKIVEFTKDMTVRAEDVREGDLIDMDEVFGILDDYGYGDDIPDNDRYASQFEYAVVELVEPGHQSVTIYNDLRNVVLHRDARVIIRRPITGEG